jgi:hypothetical protein
LNVTARSYLRSGVAIALRGRLAATALVFAYFMLLVARGGRHAWGHFGVTVYSPPFFDMRSVTSAWECTRRGIAVLPHNPCDPGNRPANYPSIWLLPSHLGLGTGSTVALGLATAVIFFVAALFVIPRGASIAEGGVYGLALCAPPVMFGVAQGNVDLLVFAVTVVGVLCLRRVGRWSAAGPVLLLFAAILKLFPIFAVPALTRLERLRARYALAAVVLGFGAYALATLGTIREILHSFPQLDVPDAYGIHPFRRWAANVSSTYAHTLPGIGLPGLAWGWIVLAAAVALGIVLRRPLRRGLGINGHDPSDERDLDLFVAGSAIYVGTFALAQNFSYRLAFLLLAIPQLYRWAHRDRLLSVAGLTLVLATLWLTAPWGAGIPVASWLLNRWDWLTSRRPFFGADLPLSAAASAQVLLAAVLIILASAALPSVRLGLHRRSESASS